MKSVRGKDTRKHTINNFLQHQCTKGVLILVTVVIVLHSRGVCVVFFRLVGLYA